MIAICIFMRQGNADGLTARLLVVRQGSQITNRGGQVNELSLFAGAGGGILGGLLLGWRTVGAVEIDPYAAGVLVARQNDRILPPFPVWSDVREFDGRPLRGLVDVISGGFPCQDISAAGKGAGIDGERSGLWSEMFRIICQVRPRYVFVENSPMLTSRGIDRVLGNLEQGGYDAAWLVLGADDVGAPHVRKRFWLLAHDADADGVHGAEPGRQHTRPEVAFGGSPNGVEPRYGVADSEGVRWGASRAGQRDAATLAGAGCACQSMADTDSQRQQQPGRADAEIRRRTCDSSQAGNASDADMPGRQEQRGTESEGAQDAAAERGSWWSVEPGMGRVAHGVAHRVDRLRALGNGQVPLVAAEAFRELYFRLHGKEYVA